MWIWIVNNSSKFHAKRLNRSENVPNSFRGLLLLKQDWQKFSNIVTNARFRDGKSLIHNFIVIGYNVQDFPFPDLRRLNLVYTTRMAFGDTWSWTRCDLAIMMSQLSGNFSRTLLYVMFGWWHEPYVYRRHSLANIIIIIIFYLPKKRRRATRKAEAHHTLVAHYITIVNMRI